MTKTEAIQAMKNGHKVTHRYFADTEYITMKGNFTIVDENGYHCEDKIFWSYRLSAAFDKDWEIFTENS
jgi:hypothetical protein